VQEPKRVFDIKDFWQPVQVPEVTGRHGCEKKERSCGSTNPRPLDELTQLPDAYNPLFACDYCTFVDQLIATQNV
jgi:hypothetical protein